MNLDKTTEFFTELGLPFAKLNAVMAGSTECFGGLLLLVGFMSRLTAIPLIFTMIVAYLTADRDKIMGIFEDPDAFVSAAPFLFMFAAVLIFVSGPGKLSVDARLRPQHTV
jgi:putative oxidoreductase